MAYKPLARPAEEREVSGVHTATTRPPPPPTHEEHYDVDLTDLDEVPDQPVDPANALILADGEKRARVALEMANMKESFSKSEIDALIDEAERRGMAFTKSRSHVVVFDGRNFTLERNTVMTRTIFRLDSLMRRLAK